jgi:hypothetical protein
MTAILTPRRNGVTRRNEWPDMTGLAMSRSHRLFLRDDPQHRRRQALDIHLTRRRERHARLFRQPVPGFWQQPVGAVVSMLLMAALIVAMFVCLYIVGSGQGGTP